MSEKIQTKVFNYGNEKESEWPPRFGTRETGRFYWDKEKQKFCEGTPPRHPVYDRAPNIITDTIDEYYHPGACTFVDSKSRLRDMDKACGTITTDKKIPPNKQAKIDRERELAKDRHDALHKAVAQIDAGTAPMTEETRELCKRQNEIVASAMPGLDPFNAVGRRNNKRGKRYKK